MSVGRRSILCAIMATLLSALGVTEASAELPCSGQLPNGGHYDLGTTCHTTWAQVERDIEQTMEIVNSVVDTVEGEAQDVVELGNELVDNTEAFVNEVLGIACQLKPDICAG